jgi:c-di-GMP-binding flagellar brake protein YcgR
MEDYRNRPRKNTPHLVRVINDDSGKTMGRVVDITADGMMLVTKELIEPGKIYNFRIVLPIMVHHRSDINLQAKAVYSNGDENSEFCRCGFKFIDLPGEDGFILEDVMHTFTLVG